MQPSSASTKAPSVQNDNNAVRPAQIRPVVADFHPLGMRRVTHQASTIFRIHDSYCSQTRARPALPPIRTIEEGIRIIEEILSKNVLCRHDVEDINQAYRGIDLLERRIDHIVEHTSLHALQKIIDRAKKIAQDKKITPADLISLYHLQNFSDKDLPITDYFNRLLSRFDKNPKNVEELASHLPCCTSEVLFDEDVQALIGPNPSSEVAAILKQKKEKLQAHVRKQKEVTERKQALAEQRAKDPQQYPPYFDELLDCGFIHLYDHLVHMKTIASHENRRAEIEKMTFSQLSHVVLEVREAIIQTVESSIPFGSDNIVFLLGPTRAGKSTAMCFLRGDKMVLKPAPQNCYESQSDRGRLIGHSETASCTFLPSVEALPDLVLVDFPGFDDTNGQLISLGMEFALKALVKKYQPKILLLQAITEKERGFKAAAELGSRLSRLLANKEHCFVGITKYSQDSNFRDIKAIEEQQKRERLASLTQEEGSLNAQVSAFSTTLPFIHDGSRKIR